MQSSLRVAFKYKTTARTAQGRKYEATDGAWKGHNGHAGSAPKVCVTPCLVPCLGKRVTPRPAYSNASAVCAPELEWPLYLLAFIKPFPMGLSSAWSLFECRWTFSIYNILSHCLKGASPLVCFKDFTCSSYLILCRSCSGRDSIGLIPLFTFSVTFDYTDFYYICSMSSLFHAVCVCVCIEVGSGEEAGQDSLVLAWFPGGTRDRRSLWCESHARLSAMCSHTWFVNLLIGFGKCDWGLTLVEDKQQGDAWQMSSGSLFV